MKFPKLSELDEDQVAIYEGAPAEGSILVIGPPGTGKTIIAFHRAGYLKRLGQYPRVVMFNKVLSHYASARDGVAADVDVSTMNSWACKWWSGAAGGRIPALAGSRWDYDWNAIRDRLLRLLTAGRRPESIRWGHLVIDEGQDFRPEMYATLNILMAVANGHPEWKPIALTVLADDNQRLEQGKNSTVEQIRQALTLHESAKNVFRLKKNYRNTREIARFAARFYVGNSSGIPELPQRPGIIPTVSVSGREDEGKNLNVFADKIAAYARLRNEQIGVLVPENSVRKSLVNRLRAKLGSQVKVQSYASDDKDALAEDLVFDEDGHVTVLNFKSAKGLEFDAVFVVDPGKLVGGSAPGDHLKMTLYVMCSRAKARLNLMLVKDASLGTLLEWIGPAEGIYKLEEL